MDPFLLDPLQYVLAGLLTAGGLLAVLVRPRTSPFDFHDFPDFLVATMLLCVTAVVWPIVWVGGLFVLAVYLPWKGVHVLMNWETRNQ